MSFTGFSQMTATTASPEGRAAVGNTPERQYTRYLIFIICASIYILPFMRLLQVCGDEGSVVYGAVRILHGQVFARDFFEVIGPGSFYWIAAFYKLFGVTFLATRVCLFVSSLGIGLLMYSLSRRVCGRYQILPCLLLVSASFSPTWPSNSHHIDSNFIALLSVACIVLWLDKRRKALLIAAGVFAGLTTCFLQPKGMLLLVAILIWLWIRRETRASTISAMAMVAAGYLGLVVVVLAYFWSQGALSSLVYANFVWPSQHYGAVNAVPYAQDIAKNYWDRWVSVKNAFSWPVGIVVVAVAVILITPLIFEAALPVLMLAAPLLPVLSDRYKWKTIAPEIALYWLGGWALWLSEIHRKDITHLVFGSPLLIIVCVYLLDKSREKLSGYALQLLLITSVWLAAFNLLGVLSAHSEVTRVGTAVVFKDDPVLAYIDAHIPSGQGMFVYPYDPRYYFLSSTVNPTRYSLLVYNYNTASEFLDAVNSLEKDQTKYVVWDPSFEAKYARELPTMKSGETSGLIMEPYLESHYKLMKEIDGYRIMERKAAEPAN
jgi:Dolichyl-phosphate-mannose-protein mannosyltransferase